MIHVVSHYKNKVWLISMLLLLMQSKLFKEI